jgi:hypothetical protein
VAAAQRTLAQAMPVARK